MNHLRIVVRLVAIVLGFIPLKSVMLNSFQHLPVGLPRPEILKRVQDDEAGGMRP